MARRTGINGNILFDVTSTAGGLLTTAQFVGTWKVGGTRDIIDLTAMGDTAKVKGVGLPDTQIDLSGHCNLGTDLMRYVNDGRARGITIIPDATNNSTVQFAGGTFYWFGDINSSVGGGVDFNLTGVTATAGAWTTGI